MIKKFLGWIGLKERIHNNNSVPPLFKEGEIWWCYLGENIGNEINGKNEQFTRPVFVYKKYDKYSFLGLPLTTTLKQGTWYVEINFIGIKQTIVLSQSRTLDYRRFKEKIGELGEDEVLEIRSKYIALHLSGKNRPPAISDGSRG